MKILSRAEELVLLAVWRLQDNAYGVTVRRLIIRETGEEWSIGAIYVPLERLAKWGYLAAEEGEPTAERGGRRKTYYRLTRAGKEALAHLRDVQKKMWNGLADTRFLARE